MVIASDYPYRAITITKSVSLYNARHGTKLIALFRNLASPFIWRFCLLKLPTSKKLVEALHKRTGAIVRQDLTEMVRNFSSSFSNGSVTDF